MSDNNTIPATRGPTKPAALSTGGSFTKSEARRTPLAPTTVDHAPPPGAQTTDAGPPRKAGFHQQSPRGYAGYFPRRLNQRMTIRYRRQSGIYPVALLTGPPVPATPGPPLSWCWRWTSPGPVLPHGIVVATLPVVLPRLVASRDRPHGPSVHRRFVHPRQQNDLSPANRRDLLLQPPLRQRVGSCSSYTCGVYKRT